MAQNIGEDYDNFVLDRRLKEVPVPTNDIDVMKYLRKLNHPICLFGEDPKDRKNRLRKLLLENMAVNIDAEDNEPQTIPKFEKGDESLIAMKRSLIEFSCQRSKERMEREKPITEERIKHTNECGEYYKDFVSTASDHCDQRALSALAVNGSSFCLGSLSGSVSVWSTESMSKICDCKGHTDRITGVDFIGDDTIISSSSDSTVRLCHCGSSSSSVCLSVPVTSLTAHPCGNLCIAGTIDGYIHLIDLQYEKTIARMKSNDGSVTALSSHTDGGLVFAGGNDTVGRLWDLRSCRAVKTLINHKGRITCSSFDSSFHCITGSCDNSVVVWDMRNLNRSKKIAAHSAPVSSVSVNCDLLLTSSLDSKLKIWSLLDFRLYSVITDSPSCIMKSCFAGDSGHTIITASKDGVWRFYTKPLF